jgi:pyruvate/2-oxoglutarate/acetoin dehydrogenase E1 component
VPGQSPEATTVFMPRLSDSMEEATIVSWLKMPGERVEQGDPLVEVETDKATIVYEAEVSGRLFEILVQEGGSALLGAPIATLSPDGAQSPDVEQDAGESPSLTVHPPNSEARAVGQLEFRAAIREALDEELERDPDVILFGEDIAVPGGVFTITPGLHEKYGPDRVFDTPISELAMVGAAFGSAVCGRRPVLEIMFGDFLPLCMDSLLNQSSKYWFLSGRTSVPLTVLSVVGGGGRFGAIHSQMPAAWFQGITGLKIVAPSSPGDAKGLLKAAIRDDNPVLFLEHKRLLSIKGSVDGEVVPIGKARVVREGTDVTIVAAMKSVHDSLEAAEQLARRGISAEVIDLRTIRPLDVQTLLDSLSKTNRVVVVEEGPLTGGWAGEVLARLAEEGLGDIEDMWRIATANGPVPYSPPLEDAFLPGAQRIVDEVAARA